MSRTLTRSFRHFEHKNPSIFSGDIGRARSVQQFRKNGRTEERRNGTEERSTVVLDDRIISIYKFYFNSVNFYLKLILEWEEMEKEGIRNKY